MNTDEYRAALATERAHCAQLGLTNRLAAIDYELARIDGRDPAPKTAGDGSHDGQADEHQDDGEHQDDDDQADEAETDEHQVAEPETDAPAAEAVETAPRRRGRPRRQG